MNIPEIARSWLGTPFYPHQARKGIGTDCVHLALAIYKEAGVIPPEVALPRYRLDGGYHLQSSTVLNWIESAPYFERVQAPQPGDLITLEMGRVVHHVGVMVTESKFVQAIRRYGVVESDLNDSTWGERVRSVWRVKG